jgi:phosphate transport system substrate-binding protein
MCVRAMTVACVGLLGGMLFTGCGPAAGVPAAGGGLSGKIEIDGSSTVFKLTQAVAQEFNKLNRGVAIKVDKSGTGGGFQKFVEGSLDICDASRPIQEPEMQKCQANGVEYIELPVCFDALTVAVNEKNDWCRDMTVAELKQLWAPDSKVARWNEIRSTWPDAKITLFGAGTDSGTFEYFTEAIVGKKNASRSDYTASEDDNVIVLGIEGDKNALGYLPYAYYAPREATLNAVAISWDKNPRGAEPVLPSRQTVEAAQYNPLARPLFIYVNRKAAERAEVKAFIEFYLANGVKMAERVKYIPLQAAEYDLARSRFDQLQSGTAFGGHTEFGLTIEELLSRQPKQ